MKQVTLKFVRFHCLDRHHCAVQYHQLIDGIIKRFEDLYSHIKIESTIMRNWYQLMYTLDKKLPMDDAPDIFHTCGGGILEELANKGLVYDLTSDMDKGWRDRFIEASLHPLRFNGREFAIPLEQGCIFVWFNKKIFEKLDLSIPSTFDDLLTLCKELKIAGIVPFTVGNGELWPGEFFFSHLFHRIGGEDLFVSDFTISPNYAYIRESFIKAAEKLIELVDAGAFPEECDTMNYEQQRMMFVQGKAAMQLNGNRLLNYLQVEGREIIDQLGFFSFPLVKGGNGKLSTIFGGSLATYAMSARSLHKEEAILFLKSLTDEFSARDIIFKMGDIPALNHIPYSEYPSPIQGRMAEKLGKMEKVYLHYFKYLPPHPAGVYLNTVARLLKKDILPEDTFKAVEEALSYVSAKKFTQTGGLAI